MKDVIEALAAAGRHGDTELTHMTLGEMVIPREIQDAEPGMMQAIMKAFNKQGVDWRKFQVGGIEDKRNPATGAREYFLGGLGVVGDVVGGLGNEGGEGGVGQQKSTPDRQAPTVSQAASQGQSVDPGYGFEREPTLGETVGTAVENTVGKQLSTPLGVAQTLLSPVPVFGQLATLGQLAADKAREAGLDVSVPAIGETPGGEAYQIEPTPVSSPGPSVQRTPGYKRPEQIQPPSTLDLSGDMTPLQQRAAIATYGTQGSASQYRDAPAADYYRNLLQRNLITPEGELAGYESVLPIEHQYLQQVLGLTYDPTTASLIDALTSTPSTSTLEQIAAA